MILRSNRFILCHGSFLERKSMKQIFKEILANVIRRLKTDFLYDCIWKIIPILLLYIFR